MTRPVKAIANRQGISAECRARIAHATSVLMASGQAVNIASVARHAGVSRQTVYQHSDLFQEIELHRGRQRHTQPTDRVLSDGETASVSSLTARLRSSSAEVTELRQRLSKSDGALVQALGTAATNYNDDETIALRHRATDLADRLAVAERTIESQAGMLQDLEIDLAAAQSGRRRPSARGLTVIPTRA